MTTRRIASGPIAAALIAGLALGLAACRAEAPAPAAARAGGSYEDVLALWREFREFQKPRLVDGVPDFTAAAMAAQKNGLPAFRDRL
ncbi:MAG: hypothetical protein HGA24_10280, partial [Candidatus Aminicenantes bacterium]|nr:hypothetical protein [Candidatus Aminicenantes bacterium]